MTKLVIIEGPMKVGKTHFIKDLKHAINEQKRLINIDYSSELRRQFFDEIFENSLTITQRKALDLGQIIGLDTILRYIKEDAIIIIDRFHLTHAIYAETFSKSRYTYLQELETRLKNLPNVELHLVYLYDSIEGISSRLGIDERNHQFDKEDIRILLRYFEEFFDLSTIENKYKINWQNRQKTIDKIIDRKGE